MNSESLDFEWIDPESFRQRGLPEHLSLPADDTAASILAWLQEILPASTPVLGRTDESALGHTAADFGLLELEEIRRKKQVIESILELLSMVPTVSPEAKTEPSPLPSGWRPRRGRVSSVDTSRKATRAHSLEGGLTAGGGAVTWVALRS